MNNSVTTMQSSHPILSVKVLADESGMKTMNNHQLSSRKPAAQTNGEPMRKRVGFPCITPILFALAQCCVALCLRAQTTNSEWQFVGPQSLPDYIVSGAAYGAGRWAATTYGWVTTLQNGATNWSYPTAVTTSADQGWSRMAFLGGKFLFWGVGEINSFNPLGIVVGVPKMVISDDGLFWQPSQGTIDGITSVFAPGGVVESAAYGNGAYVAVGEQGITTLNEDRQ